MAWGILAVMRRRPTVYARQAGRRVHVARGDRINQAWCGAEVHGPEYLARLVPLGERCTASGCRQRWPALLSAVR